MTAPTRRSTLLAVALAGSKLTFQHTASSSSIVLERTAQNEINLQCIGSNTDL